MMRTKMKGLAARRDGQAWQRRARRRLTDLALSLSAAAASFPVHAVHLRIVGGLADVHQYTRHEEPFWSRELAQLSGGRHSAEIVPFDRAGIRGQEVLSLIKLGVVPFGTVLLNLSSAVEPEVGAADLAGMNPDLDTMRRSLDALRPHLEEMLRRRHGIEVLAAYVYPAQVTFCQVPITSFADLAGKRVRTANVGLSDLMRGLGATPVNMPFAEVLQSLRSGRIDCAVTGTMSGFTIGLPAVATHLHPLPLGWGVAIFAANGEAWQALPADLRELLRRELPRVERAVWAEAKAETAEGIACNVGTAGCQAARKGRMQLVPVTDADRALVRRLFTEHVLPRWIQRCGATCVDLWNQALEPVTHIRAVPRPGAR